MRSTQGAHRFRTDQTRAAPAPFERPGWIFHPRIISTLEKLKDARGRYLADAGLLTIDATGGGGTLLGLPFRTTTQVATNVTRGTSNDTTTSSSGRTGMSAGSGEQHALRIDASGEASYSWDGTT